MTEKLTNTAQVKAFAGIADAAKDTAIAVWLPAAEDAVLEITKNSWDCVIQADYANGGTALTVKNILIFTGNRSWNSSGYQWFAPDDDVYKVSRIFDPGNVVDGDDIDARSVISSISGNVITIDNATTAAGSDAEVRVNIAGDSLKSIIAQMVLYNVDFFDGDYQVSLDGESVGSYSYSIGNEGVGASGYPVKFTNALSKYSKPVFK